MLTRVPFVTRFNTGEGSDFFVEGRAAGGGNWNMLSAQDPAPTEACGEDDTLGASIDYDNAAYDGGSSLRIAGTATADSRRLYLYETNAPLPQRAAFTLRYRQLPARRGAAPEPHVVVWVDGKGPIDLEPTRRSTTGQRWTSIQAHLPADVPPGTLTRIGVGFDLERSQPVDTLIGELGVVDLDAYQPPKQIRRHASAGKLTWHDPSPSTTQYYNVWTVRRSCLAFVGRTTLQLYDLSHPLFGTPATRGRFVVQPVNTSGLASHLSPPPC